MGELSVPVVFRYKAQPMALVLVKRCNAVAGHHVGLSVSMAVLSLLPRTKAIRCETRLAMNADRPTESVNITWTVY